MVQISLCIATMDRWNFLEKYLEYYIFNPYIGEIIISDENGNDMQKIQEKYGHINHLKCFLNSGKHGAFHNKRHAVSKATFPWICLMDSDNFAPIDYFKTWEMSFDEADPTIIYCPSKTLTTDNKIGYDFSNVDNIIYTKDNYKELFKKFNYNHLSIGNYIFNRDFFLKAEHKEEFDNLDTECYCYDVVYQNYLLLENGGSIKTINNMAYFHEVHLASYYFTTNNKVSIDKIEKLFL